MVPTQGINRCLQYSHFICTNSSPYVHSSLTLLLFSSVETFVPSTTCAIPVIPAVVGNEWKAGGGRRQGAVIVAILFFSTCSLHFSTIPLPNLPFPTGSRHLDRRAACLHLPPPHNHPSFTVYADFTYGLAAFRCLPKRCGCGIFICAFFYQLLLLLLICFYIIYTCAVRLLCACLPVPPGQTCTYLCETLPCIFPPVPCYFPACTPHPLCVCTLLLSVIHVYILPSCCLGGR